MKKMIVAIHQPQFLPWIGYFHKMMVADAFCLLDDVQFKKNEWQNRNRIKTAKGWQWLTVPVKYKFPQKINEVSINETVNWHRKHLASLKFNYAKSRFFVDYLPIIEGAYEKAWATISDLNCTLIHEIRNILNIQDKPIVRSSELSGLSEHPTQRLIDICGYFRCDTYLAGAGGPNYMEMERFEENGIKVMVQAFDHPVYPQCFGGFQSHMSVIDLIFNCGPQSAEIICGKTTDDG